MVHKRRTGKHVAKGYMIGIVKDRKHAVDDSTNTRRSAPSKTLDSDDSPAPTTSKPFRLLDLPQELVLRVLRFSVVHSSNSRPIEIFRSLKRPAQSINGAISGAPYKKGASDLVQPAITRTCRLLRHEGLKKFYSSNYFLAKSNLEDRDAMIRWLRCLHKSEWSQYLTLQVMWMDDVGPIPVNKLLGMKWQKFRAEMAFLRDGMRNMTAWLPLRVFMFAGRVLIGRRENCCSYFGRLEPQKTELSLRGESWTQIRRMSRKGFWKGRQSKSTPFDTLGDPSITSWWIMADMRKRRSFSC